MYKVSCCMLTNTYDWDNIYQLADKMGTQRNWADFHAAPICKGLYKVLNMGACVSLTLCVSRRTWASDGMGYKCGSTVGFFSQMPIRTRTCAYQGGKKCLFFGKFCVVCFLVTPIFRFAILPYHRLIWEKHLFWIMSFHPFYRIKKIFQLLCVEIDDMA